MEAIEKAIIIATTILEEKKERFLEKNWVISKTKKNYKIIYENKYKTIEITIFKKPGFFGRLIGQENKKIAKMEFLFDKLVKDLFEQIKEQESFEKMKFEKMKDVAKKMSESLEELLINKKAKNETTHKVNIKVGVDLSEANKKLKEFAEKMPNLEKPLKSKRATNEKNTAKNNLKKKKKKTRNWTKWKNSF